MLDKLLEVGATFDYFTPLASVLGDVLHGPSHTFLVPYSASPLSGREIGRMLGKRGVKCWGLTVVSGTLMVSVHQSKADKALRLLDKAGVPVENRETPVVNVRPKRKQRAKAGPFSVFNIFRG